MGTPVVWASGFLVDESAGFVDFVLQLSEAPAADLALGYHTSSASASSSFSFDYTDTGNQTVTFAAGQTTQTIRVSLTDNLAAEQAESFYLNLTVPTGSSVLLGNSQAVATILDEGAEDAALTGLPVLRIADAVVDEKTGRAYFTVTLDRPATQAISIGYATENGTAQAGADYEGVTGVVSFAPGQLTQTVAVNLVDDGDAESGEFFDLAFVSTPVGAVVADGRGSAFIGASDAPSVDHPVVSVSDTVVNEGQGYAEFVLSLSAPAAAPMSVGYHTSSASASSSFSFDYTDTGNQTVTFAAGQTTQTIRVSLTDDLTAEQVESFYLNLTVPTGSGVVLGKSQGVATIVDEDGISLSGTPVVTISDAIVDEKAGRAYFTVTLDRPSTSAVSLIYATVDHTAKAGTDYDALIGQTLGFGAGETVKTIVVNLRDDQTAELGGGYFEVVLSNANGATLGDTAGRALIGASDTAEITSPTVHVADTVVNEAQGYAEFVLSLSAPAAAPMSVGYHTSSASASSSFSFDYTDTGNQTVTFAAGQTTQTIRVSLTDNLAAEQAESFYLNLTVPTGSSVLLGNSQAVATILDEGAEDAALTGLPVLRIADAVVDEKTGRAYFTVTLDRPATQAISIGYATENGTAQAGADYEGVTGVVSFAPGQLTQTVAVNLVDDGDAESGEFFDLAFVSTPVGAVVADGRGSAFIGASDAPSVDHPVVSVSDTVVNEGQGYAEFVLSLSAPAAAPMSVGYHTSSASASSSFSFDYTDTGNQTVTFAAGQTTQTIRVSLTDDLTAEQVESFYLNLTVPTGSGVVLGNNAATGTIVDDDGQTTPAASVADVSVNELLGTVSFVVSLSSKTSDQVAIGYTTSNGTALAGSDYLPTGLATLTFEPGETTKLVTVALVDDSIHESAETFALDLFSAQGATVEDGHGVATIVDNDPGYTPIDYELMAGAAYSSTRTETNQIPHPEATGWKPLVGFETASDPITGFEAAAFINGTDICIAFAGTYFNSLADVVADLNLGSTQLPEAALFYERVKEAHPDATSITFTGHSLGGGLAALMGVYFDRPAVTFDQAPFAATANLVVQSDLAAVLLAHGYLDSDLLTFYRIPLVTIRGEEGITAVAVEGEFLQFFPDASKIFGGSTLINHGSTDVSHVDLHSQALLIAFTQSEALRLATYALPFLIKDLLDTNLYGAATDSSTPDLLTQLIRHEFGVPGEVGSDTDRLSKFAADVTALAHFSAVGQQGLEPLLKLALGHYHYLVGYASRLFFTPVPGGLRFDLNELGDLSLADPSKLAGYGDFLAWVKTLAPGASQYIGDFLGTESQRITVSLGSSINGIAPSDNTADFLLSGSAGGTLVGGGGDDLLAGRAGVDRLDGGSGNDSLVGGTGNDTYVVDSVSDVISETSTLATELDSVQSAVTWTLGANLERLTLTGAGAINGVGNSLANTISGNTAVNSLSGVAGNDTLSGGAGNDVLNGGSGNDSLVGGTGNDTYVVDSAADIISETSTLTTEIDTVQSAVTWTLGANLERLTLTGSSAVNGTGNTLANLITGNAAANTLSGSAGNDTLNGGAGNDILSGGTGNDSLIGGAGNDTYVIDSSGDTISELGTASSTTDQVQSAVTWTLGANLERLTLTGSGAVNGTGNTLANLITGNAAANTLSGGTGNDTLNGGVGNDILSGGTGNDNLIGGDGNDTYVIDGSGDTISELGTVSSTTDLVQSAVTWTLGANLERLTLTGSGAVNGTGNTLANLITGNAAANTLSGGTGNDTLNGGAGNDILSGGTGNDSLIGGDGNDTYVIDSSGDTISELGTVSSTTDLVQSAVTWTLGANLERLTLAGSGAVNGTGNTLANLITGNAAANTLSGGTGNDTLNGGAGNDILSGGTGNDALSGGAGLDAFRFSASLSVATNVDRLGDFVAADDTIVVDDAVFTGIGALGALAAGAFRVGSAAADATDRIVYNASTGQLFFDSDGSGAGSAILFATLTAGTTLTAGDFFVI